MNDAPVPAHLRSSHRMLKAAFPEGIGREDYLVLLSLLRDEFSQRNLAELMTHCFGANYYDALHDVYGVGSAQHGATPEALERIKARLIPHGYLDWLKEE